MSSTRSGRVVKPKQFLDVEDDAPPAKKVSKSNTSAHKQDLTKAKTKTKKSPRPSEKGKTAQTTPKKTAESSNLNNVPKCPSLVSGTDENGTDGSRISVLGKRGHLSPKSAGGPSVEEELILSDKAVQQKNGNEEGNLNSPSLEKRDVSLPLGERETPPITAKKHVEEKKVINLSQATPPSTVRRSSRASRPSSRFKDMDLGTRKRSHGSVVSEGSEVNVETASKKIRSEKSQPVLPDSVETKNVLEVNLSQDIVDTERVKDDVLQKITDKEANKTSAPQDVANKATIEYSALQDVKTRESIETSQPHSVTIKEKEENSTPQDVDKKETSVPHSVTIKEKEENSTPQDVDKKETNVPHSEANQETDQVIVLQETSASSDVAKSVTVSEIKNETIQSHLEAQRNNVESENLADKCTSLELLKELTEGDAHEIEVSQDGVEKNEEVEMTVSHAGVVIEETVHTYMDEKDVVVVEQPDISQKGSQTKGEITTPDGSCVVLNAGDIVTDTDETGKTLSIVLVPGKLGEKQADNGGNSASLNESSQTIEGTFTLPSGKSPVEGNKSKHGYILNKKKENHNSSYHRVVGQDGSGILNIAVESPSVTKPKTGNSSPKIARSHGTVLKQDSAVSAMIAKDVSESGSIPGSFVIQDSGSNKNQSSIPPLAVLKGINQAEGKAYTLLSPPSELRQKLQEKKAQSKNTFFHGSIRPASQTPLPKKVVLFAHSATAESSATLENSSTADAQEVGYRSKTQEVLIQLPNEEKEETIPVAKEGKKASDLLIAKLKEHQIRRKLLGAETEELIITPVSTEAAEVSGSERGAAEPEHESDIALSGDTTIVGKDENSGSKAEEEKKIKDDKSLSGEEKEDENGTTVSVLSDDVISIEIQDPNVEIKQEVETSVKGEGKELSEEASNKSEDGTKKTVPRTQKIKFVDNGVVYEFQILTDQGMSTLVAQPGEVKGSLKSDSQESSETKETSIKKEPDEEGTVFGTEETAGKQSSATQTVFTTKRGRPRISDDKSDGEMPVHKLTTIVHDGGQKRHYYYVSVLPGKTTDGKYRRSVDHSLPGCLINEDGHYCCRECEYKTDKKANFYKHRRLHTGSKPHTCPVCRYQARTSSNLKRHMGIHQDIREFKCRLCSMSFRQKIHLERHVRYRHEEKRVKCPMCDYVCANEQPDLKMHMKRKHTRESGKTFSCPECNTEVGSRKDLKQHLKFHKDGPELKLFCKECSFVTDCKSRLQRHLVVHSNVKPFHCGVCDYKATQKEHVVRHLRSQHKIEVNKPKRAWKKQPKLDPAENGMGNQRGDFTCGDKIFACNHCTMRFAKLINLYKHLHTQHSDIMPQETSGNYYCVVCEFSTTSKKNLLVHMRRHNMTDQTPPTHVYSCVLCRYVNPRRRNLFQHMRKKHNVEISNQVEISGIVEEEVTATQAGEKGDDGSQVEQKIFAAGGNTDVNSSGGTTTGNLRMVGDDLAGVASMIKIEDLTRVQASAETEAGVDQTLVIDAGVDKGSSEMQVLQSSSILHHEAADAIEGLQALASQAGLIIEEEVPVIDEHQTIVIEQAPGEVITAQGTTLEDGSIIISSDQVAVGEQISLDGTGTEHIQQIVESVEAAEDNSGITGLELTEEQIASLRHGDMVEIEGQVLMVELTQDPDSPDKQLLSFLPVSQG